MGDKNGIGEPTWIHIDPYDIIHITICLFNIAMENTHFYEW